MSMRKYRVLFLILLLSLCFSVTAFAQENGPPPPDTKRHGGGPPCDPGRPGNPGNVPPPVGLCLPIDDYIYALMAVGVMYGCYKMRKFEAS